MWEAWRDAIGTSIDCVLLITPSMIGFTPSKYTIQLSPMHSGTLHVGVVTTLCNQSIGEGQCTPHEPLRYRVPPHVQPTNHCANRHPVRATVQNVGVHHMHCGSRRFLDFWIFWLWTTRPILFSNPHRVSEAVSGLNFIYPRCLSGTVIRKEQSTRVSDKTPWATINCLRVFNLNLRFHRQFWMQVWVEHEKAHFAVSLRLSLLDIDNSP